MQIGLESLGEEALGIDVERQMGKSQGEGRDGVAGRGAAV